VENLLEELLVISYKVMRLTKGPMIRARPGRKQLKMKESRHWR